MFTRNYYWNIHETVLWTIAVGLLVPIALYLLRLIHKHTPQGYDNTQLKYFCYMLILTGICFTIELCWDHIPCQIRTWKEHDAAGKEFYMDLLPGIKSSMFDRIMSQTYETWKDDMFWMACYFSLGVWTAVLMVNAPRMKRLKAKSG